MTFNGGRPPGEYMAIKIANQKFVGPFPDLSKVREQGGIYAILGLQQDKYRVLDVGQAGGLNSRLSNHDRKDQWRRQGLPLSVAVLYTPNWTEAQRCAFETQVRTAYNPPCGDR